MPVDSTPRTSDETPAAQKQRPNWGGSRGRRGGATEGNTGDGILGNAAGRTFEQDVDSTSRGTDNGRLAPIEKSRASIEFLREAALDELEYSSMESAHARLNLQVSPRQM
jgi:hypothetical protein